MRRILFLAALQLATPALNLTIGADTWGSGPVRTYNLQDYASTVFTPGSDILPALKSAFGAIQASGAPAMLTIPAGSYTCPSLVASGPCTAPNNCTVMAQGVTVTYPTMLAGAPGYPAVIFCQGTDVQNFSWTGGTFIGFDYDTSTGTDNGWAPQETVCTFSFSSASTGCSNIAFAGLNGMNSGCMVRVAGINTVDGQVRQWPTTLRYLYTNTTVACTGVTLSNCTFTNCGQVYFDYGYLWQILTFQSHYSAALVDMATQYMNPIGWTTGPSSPHPVSITFSGSEIQFDNSTGVVPQEATNNAGGNPVYMVTFGPGSQGTLPGNVTPGLQYYVAASNPGYIQIAATPNGAPLDFTGSPTPGCDMFYNMNRCYWDMFVPDGADQLFDGSFQLVDCANVQVQNCTWSSPGDSEVMEACQTSTISGGSITDAKMGALFFGGCLNTTVENLSCNGGDGSRVLSLEYGDNQTTISGCCFTGGGRGSIINYSKNLTVNGNTFTLNDGKTAPNTSTIVPDPAGSFATNRITYATGNWEQDPAFLIENNLGTDPSTEIIFADNTVVVQPTGIDAIQVQTLLEGWFFDVNSFQVGSDSQGASALIQTPELNLSSQNYWGTNPGTQIDASGSLPQAGWAPINPQRSPL